MRPRSEAKLKFFWGGNWSNWGRILKLDLFFFGKKKAGSVRVRTRLIQSSATDDYSATGRGSMRRTALPFQVSSLIVIFLPVRSATVCAPVADLSAWTSAPAESR